VTSTYALSGLTYEASGGVEVSAPFESEFRQRFDELYASLFRYLDRLSGDAALAADIAQESLVRLYRRGRMPDDLRAWLVTVAHNQLRTTRRQERRRSFLLAIRAIVAPPDAPVSADRALEEDEQRVVVRVALAVLTRREREMLLLHSEGFSYREISVALRIRETSVGTLLRRAKQRFAQALGEDPRASS
jgi:RNA polymerase sigma factor (sigma-70 family)